VGLPKGEFRRAPKDRHRWSATCYRVAASKLLEDFTNFRSWREAESSIRIQEGPPANRWLNESRSRSPHQKRRASSTLPALSPARLVLYFEPDQAIHSSSVDSAGSSHETAGLHGFLLAERSLESSKSPLGPDTVEKVENRGLRKSREYRMLAISAARRT
jgi:hypothetical protein